MANAEEGEVRGGDGARRAAAAPSPSLAAVSASIRHLADELGFMRSALAHWCESLGGDPLELRTALTTHVRAGARRTTGPPRVARRLRIVLACDLDGETHKVAAASLGLSRAQFYRERRLALEELREVASRWLAKRTGAVTRATQRAPALTLVTEGKWREDPLRTLNDLVELRAMLAGASKENAIAAELEREARRAIAALRDEERNPIAL